MIIRDNAISYYGKHDWPSNFFEEPVRITIYKSKPDYVFPTGEHAFQACKAALFNDMHALRLLVQTPSPWLAKRIGRDVRGYDDELWSKRSFTAMCHVLKSRVNSSELIYRNALAVKDKVFIESSPTDFLWGNGICGGSMDTFNPAKWKGKNLHGRAWSAVLQSLELR